VVKVRQAHTGRVSMSSKAGTMPFYNSHTAVTGLLIEAISSRLELITFVKINSSLRSLYSQCSTARI
jgi:hypothetical protein